MMEFSDAGLVGAAAGAGIGIIVDRGFVGPWIKREIQARVADGRETQETAPHRLSVFQLYRVGFQVLFPIIGYVGGSLFGAG